MKISLKRFCEKGRDITTINFDELRQKQDAPIWKKTPSYLQLQNSNDVILYRYPTADGTFTILQSGFIHINYNDGTQHTVIPTTKSYTLYQDDQPRPRRISIADFLPLPFENALAVLLDLRIEINKASKARYNEPKEIDLSGDHYEKNMKTSTKLTYTPPTVIDELLDQICPDDIIDYRQKLNEALPKLKPLQYSVIYKYYLENKSERVIAEELSMTRENVQYHRNTALKKLKQICK